MQKSPEDWLQQAVDLAINNVRGAAGGPFGALIVKDGALLSTGVNLVTTAHDPTAHAEILAIRRACEELRTFQLTGCELYASCEPCPMCLGAIYWARLDGYYFSGTRADAAKAGFDDTFIHNQLELKPQQRAIRGQKVSLPNAWAPFAEWARSPEKITY